MFKNARGTPVETSDDEASTGVTPDDSSDVEEPLLVKRTPRLRSAKSEPDTSD